MNVELKFSLIPQAEQEGFIGIDANTAYDPAAGRSDR